MATSTEQLVAGRGHRLLDLAVDPYAIAGAATAAAASLAIADAGGLVPWVVLVGVVAGWSSAWSP